MKIGDFFFKYRNFVFPIIIGVILLPVAPPSTVFGSEALEGVEDFVGIVMALVGLVMRGVVIGYAYIKRGGLNKQVYADKLVTEGLFSICRNPLYFGNMLIYSGIFLMHGNFLITLTGIAIFYFIYICIIATEENYLRNKFGADYETYCANTPRWIPQFSKFKEAITDMEFDFKKAILKDYSTIFNTIITLALIQQYEYIAMEGSVSWSDEFLILAIIGASIAAMIGIRKYKKKQKAA